MHVLERPRADVNDNDSQLYTAQQWLGEFIAWKDALAGKRETEGQFRALSGRAARSSERRHVPVRISAAPCGPSQRHLPRCKRDRITIPSLRIRPLKEIISERGIRCQMQRSARRSPPKALSRGAVPGFRWARCSAVQPQSHASGRRPAAEESHATAVASARGLCLLGDPFLGHSNPFSKRCACSTMRTRVLPIRSGCRTISGWRLASLTRRYPPMQGPIPAPAILRSCPRRPPSNTAVPCIPARPDRLLPLAWRW
jgi:hypothetical protein